MAAATFSLANATGCLDKPPCKGCGCEGGPGYRARDGHCAGFRERDKVCGVPPDTNCVFESAPGTGENHNCALAPRKRARPLVPLPAPG